VHYPIPRPGLEKYTMSSKKEYSYVLLTAARNEEQCIGLCIESVLSQSVLPCKWVIISDGSTDDTEIIIKNYVKDHPFIQFIRKEPDQSMKGFASKVFALQMGVNVLKGLDYPFIGILDADITLEKEYYAKMLDRFNNNSNLGIGGGCIFERKDGVFKRDVTHSPWSVAGGIQLFRSKCYQDIGGLKPMPLGGEDWHAEIQARMQGWEVEALPDVPAFHHNPGAPKRGIIREAIREGAMDYSMGSHPLFEFLKCLRRIQRKPYLVFAIIRMYGFLRPCLVRQQRQVTKDVMIFLRNEQLSRLKKMFIMNSGL
jgi:poly-beta-1,6-N-acetyl-D-glucosamine synthase